MLAFLAISSMPRNSPEGVQLSVEVVDDPAAHRYIDDTMPIVVGRV